MLEVIELTADGLDPAQVAARMGICATTVKSRLQVLYRHLEVETPTAVVREAMRRQLIE